MPFKGGGEKVGKGNTPPNDKTNSSSCKAKSEKANIINIRCNG